MSNYSGPPATVDTLNSQAQTYKSNLQVIANADTSPPFSWIPNAGNYAGNGVNDFWNKAEALAQTWFPQYTEDFTKVHTTASLQDATNMMNAMQSVDQPAGDPIGIFPSAQSNLLAGDPIAETHDQQHALANGNVGLEVAADEKFAAGEIAASVKDGNPYEAVEGVFMGTIGAAADVIYGAANLFGGALSAIYNKLTGPTPVVTVQPISQNTVYQFQNDDGATVQAIIDSSGNLSNTLYQLPTGTSGTNEASLFDTGLSVNEGSSIPLMINDFSTGNNTIGINQNSTYTVNATKGDTINTDGTMTLTVSGEDVRTNIWAGDTANIIDSGYSGTGLDGVVATQNSTDNVNIGYNGEATVIGNGGTLNFTGSYATQYVQTAAEYVYSVAGITHDVVYANNERLYISSSDQTTVVGNHDTISGSSGDDFAVYGDYDPVSGNDLDVDYYGNNYTGDTVSGSGDDYGDEGGDDGGGGDYGGYYGYALTATAATAKTSGTNIGAIAANDLSMNDRIGAVGSQTARLQANAALAGAVGSGAVLEGPKWDSKVITWSLATDLGSANVPFTGTIGQQYEATIEGAFEQWAAASGLKFEEVSDSTSADIRLGWSSFDPTTSGVLGYTALKAKAGVAQADTLIGLENPTEDALVTGSNGQLAYSGTQTELSQLVLHEIGHALGLADDSDVNSIMYPTLSTANETLDSTDIAGIQSLYAPATITSTLGDILAASGSALSATSLSAWSSFQSSASTLIDSMATFDPTPLSASQSPTLAQVAAVATVPPAWLAAQVSH